MSGNPRMGWIGGLLIALSLVGLLSLISCGGGGVNQNQKPIEEGPEIVNLEISSEVIGAEQSRVRVAVDSLFRIVLEAGDSVIAEPRFVFRIAGAAVPLHYSAPDLELVHENTMTLMAVPWATIPSDDGNWRVEILTENIDSDAPLVGRLNSSGFANDVPFEDDLRISLEEVRWVDPEGNERVFIPPTLDGHIFQGSYE